MGATLVDAGSQDPFALRNWVGARPAWETPLWGLTERLLGLRRLGRLYPPLAGLSPEDFCAGALAALEVTIPELPEAEAELRRLRGPVLVVANHPFGAIEALWLMRFLGRAGRNYRLLANHWLGALPELRPRLLGVDVLSGQDAPHRNAAALRAASRWLADGGVLGLFPAGEVASLSWARRRVEEAPWSGHGGRLALRHRATVLPIHFRGRNGALFQALGLLHPRLRTAWLAREAGRRGRVLRVAVGVGLPPEDLACLAPVPRLAAALRAHTLALVPESPALAVRPRRALDPVPGPEALEAEVQALEAKGRGLASEGPYQALWFRGGEAPALMRAIAVGRERTFRDAGEGTGQSRDEDVFDRDYTQILLWDGEARAVAGAYRAVAAAGRWREVGDRGLYSATLFGLDPRLGPDLEGALELGRSYVAAAWQRQALPLLLLWRAVGAYALGVAGCTRLFGCVSISPDFHTNTQRLLLRFLAERSSGSARRGWARPVNEPTELLEGEGPQPEDLRGLERWVRILERGRRGVPPLLKHYLTLGAQVLAFNRDPAFNGTVDALVLLDLEQAPPRLLRRYLAPRELDRLSERKAGSPALAARLLCAP